MVDACPPACCSTYINPKATGKDIIRVSRYVIVIFGLLLGVLAIILFQVLAQTARCCCSPQPVQSVCLFSFVSLCARATA